MTFKLGWRYKILKTKESIDALESIGINHKQVVRRDAKFTGETDAYQDKLLHFETKQRHFCILKSRIKELEAIFGHIGDVYE